MIIMDMKKQPYEIRILSIAIIGIVSYIIVFAGLSPILAPQPVGMRQMMAQMAGYNTPSVLLNGAAAVIALLVLLAASRFLFYLPSQQKTQKNDEISILKRALSEDEKRMVEEIERAPKGITQDSLRFRLEWSKPKVSAILTNLDRMNLIQRERLGKTYRVLLQKETVQNG